MDGGGWGDACFRRGGGGGGGGGQKLYLDLWFLGELAFFKDVFANDVVELPHFELVVVFED